LPLVLLVLTVLAAGCGDDGADTTAATEPVATAAPATTAAPVTTAAPTTTEAVTTTQAPTTTEAPTTTVPGPPELPVTPVVTVVDQGYKFGDEAGVATDDDLPFALGSIEAHWYNAGDRYAVVYVGLDLDETGPLCPGSSLLGPQGFKWVTNSPTPGASCEGSMAEIIGPPIGTQICGGLVSYLTQIEPVETGTLYASIEIYTGTGTNYGASGVVEFDRADLPGIDPAWLSC
jgi:hypothetical protein